jgi:hypothetical protein
MPVSIQKDAIYTYPVPLQYLCLRAVKYSALGLLERLVKHK